MRLGKIVECVPLAACLPVASTLPFPTCISRLRRCSLNVEEITIMPKPTPNLVNKEKLVDLAFAVIKADRFPYLATVDGNQPRVRPVSPVRTEGFIVYVAKLLPKIDKITEMHNRIIAGVAYKFGIPLITRDQNIKGSGYVTTIWN